MWNVGNAAATQIPWEDRSFYDLSLIIFGESRGRGRRIMRDFATTSERLNGKYVIRRCTVMRLPPVQSEMIPNYDHVKRSKYKTTRGFAREEIHTQIHTHQKNKMHSNKANEVSRTFIATRRI
jgi:hypothetical protein